jgi:hypothetical protein
MPSRRRWTAIPGVQAVFRAVQDGELDAAAATEILAQAAATLIRSRGDTPRLMARTRRRKTFVREYLTNWYRGARAARAAGYAPAGARVAAVRLMRERDVRAAIGAGVDAILRVTMIRWKLPITECEGS